MNFPCLRFIQIDVHPFYRIIGEENQFGSISQYYLVTIIIILKGLRIVIKLYEYRRVIQ